MELSQITQFYHDLYLIKIAPPLTGFDNFIGVWLFKGEKNFIVDVGPAVTSLQLIQALNKLHIDHLDYILLTHIHIDHAGAIGNIAAHFPHTPIICHAKGISHLAEPSRLWEGTLKTLGKTAQKYHPFTPVPSDRFISADQFTSSCVTAIETLGHSPHHVSFITDDYLFAGEAGGVCLSIRAPDDYLRPASPPRFYFDVYLDSIDRLLLQNPKIIAYGHFGLAVDAQTMLKKHRKQLFVWKEVIGDIIKHSSYKSIETECMEQLLEQDNQMQGFASMSDDTKKRELGFLRNSIKGFAGFLSQ
ncbi:MBL fold metallo-hydrolase [Desulfococcaceae bacterium HSG7]|nr:MBL fold metallo-hydrolase [Desulfococcaceae bacterium HSG7]